MSAEGLTPGPAAMRPAKLLKDAESPASPETGNLRFLLVSFEFHPVTGGAGTSVSNLARGISQSGYGVDVLTSSFGGDFEASDRAYPFGVIRLPGSPPRKRIDWIFRAVQLASWMKRKGGNYSVVLLADWTGAVLFNLTRWYTRRPYACYVHGSEVNAFHSSPALRFMSRGLYHGASASFCNSRYTAGLLRERFPGVPAHRVHVLPVAIHFPDVAAWPSRREETREALDILPDHFVLLQLSRLVDRKGHVSVLEALSGIPERDLAGMMFLVAGKGPLLEELKARSAKLKLERNVRFLGYVPDDRLPMLYDASDVFVMPSLEVKQRVEGFGIVYLEAAMRGKPSIGSRHGGIPEVVLDGETGFLVNPADAHELREKILLLKEGKGLRETMGKKAEERARALFSPRTIAGIFVQISQDGWRAGLREERMT